MGVDNYHLPLCHEKDFLAAYNLCFPLKSLIGKRSKAFNSGIIQAINPNTKKEVKSGRAAQLRKLIRKPNVLQIESQFQAQQNTYVDIFGYCPVLKIRPSGMPDQISALWNIPPWLFDIDYTRKWLMQNRISGIYKNYYIEWEGERIEIPHRDLFFVFDDGIGTQNDTNLTIPDSRLVGADYVVSNIIASMKSRNTLLVKRGAIGILSNEAKDIDLGSIPFKKGTKEALQDDFKQYGLTGQAFQVIITDANVKWQQMGFPTKELLMFEEVDANTGHLCDLYGTPSILMTTAKVGTYENQNQARKDFIENTIIPESASRMEQFSNGIVFDVPFGEVPETEVPESERLAIVRDYSKLSILQEDTLKAAQAQKMLDDALLIEYKAGLITKNDWREKQGMERITDDPTFDEYYDEAAAKEAETQAQIAIQTAKVGAKGKLSGAAK